jgi:hypothetical protein
MFWERIGYAALCVIVPVAWGLLVWWTSNHIEKVVLAHGRRKGQDDAEATMPPIDYHI